MKTYERDNDKYSQLEQAINMNDFDTFLEIIEQYEGTDDEMDADYCFDNGDTLVIRAIKLKCKSITTYLIKAGADLSIKDADGISCMKLLVRALFGCDKHKEREETLKEMGILN